MTRPLDAEPPTGADAQRPRRRAQSRVALIAIGAVLAVIAGIAGLTYVTLLKPPPLRIAVGPPNSDDLKVVQAIAQAFGRERNYVRLRPVITDGASASATALAEGKVDLAVIRGDLELPRNAQAVATLRKNVVVLWAPPQPKAKKGAVKITKLSQLAGRRVGIIGRTQANPNLLKLILQQYAVDASRVEIVRFSTNEVAEAVRGQKVDVLMAVGPVNSRITADAIAASTREGGLPTFIPIESADAIAQNHSIYEASEIPAGSFGGSPAKPDDDVKTISFPHHIVARKSLSDMTVAAFTRQLFAVRQAVTAELPRAASIETPDTDKDAAVPAHPGAAAYVDGEEKTFLDRYSDFIWWGIMGLSMMGSAGAWFAGYLKKDARLATSPLRERLLAMLSLARVAPSHDDLDALQGEADEILRQALDAFENGAMEEGTLTAFNIALEQFHNAVADRRLVFASTPPAVARTPRPAVA